MAKILVTGGLGYIGSHTVVELQNEGFEVIVIDDLSNSSIETLDRIKSISGIKPLFEELDLKEKLKVEAFFKKHSDIKGVIHFAASKAVGESVHQPLLYYENNISTLVYVLKEMEKLETANFIFSSSCTVYGQADELPITEKAPVKIAESPYGNTKQIGEEIIQDVCKINPNIKAISLRYFNPIGAHESAIIGELPIGVPQNLVPFITQSAIGLRAQLSVFGDDYPTEDGTCIRDYIHVDDLAQAHLDALSFLEREKRSLVANCGYGHGYSVEEVINVVKKITGVDFKVNIVGRRDGDAEKLISRADKIKKELGWQPKYNDLEKIVETAYLWEKKLIAGS